MSDIDSTPPDLATPDLAVDLNILASPHTTDTTHITLTTETTPTTNPTPTSDTVSPTGATSTPDNSDSKLLKIPLEIRLGIYKLLLFNPELGEGSALSQELGYGKEKKYDLHPVILRVCKQIHGEAIDVLYHLNKFLIDCTFTTGLEGGDSDDEPPVELDHADDFHIEVQSAVIHGPFFRYHHNSDAYPTYLFRYSSPGDRYTFIDRVKQWRILVSASKQVDSASSLLELCRAIAPRHGLSFEILIISAGIEDDDAGSKEYHDLREVLEPLRLLRNARSVEFKPADLNDIPDYCFGDDMASEFNPILPSVQLENELTELIEGDSHGTFLLSMFVCLLDYAEAFERIPEFKGDMSRPPGESELKRVKGPAFDFHANPFKLPKPHPVEEYLENSLLAVFRYDVQAFRNCRRELFDYLELWYDRIRYCGFKVNEYLKREKMKHGVFVRNAQCPFNHKEKRQWWDRVTEGLVLINDYVESFDRQNPEYIRMAILTSREDLRQRYDSLLRVQLTKDMHEAYNNYNYYIFTVRFRELVDELDDQFAEINKARNELLDRDDPDKVDIHFQKRDFEHINWDVVEPDFRVELNDGEFRPFSREDYEKEMLKTQNGTPEVRGQDEGQDSMPDSEDDDSQSSDNTSSQTSNNGGNSYTTDNDQSQISHSSLSFQASQ